MNHADIVTKIDSLRTQFAEILKTSLPDAFDLLSGFLCSLEPELEPAPEAKKFAIELNQVIQGLNGKLQKLKNSDVLTFLLNDCLDNFVGGLNSSEWNSRQTSLFLFSTFEPEYDESKAALEVSKSDDPGLESSQKALVQEEDLSAVPHLLFECAEGSFGLDLSFVREVIELHNLVSLPSPKEKVLGLINFRGEVFPLLNLEQTLGRFETGRSRFVIICSSSDQTFGIPVEYASHIENMDLRSDSSNKLVPSPRSYLKTVVNVGEKSYKILNLGKIAQEDARAA